MKLMIRMAALAVVLLTLVVATAAQDEMALVNIGSNDTVDAFLVGPDGLTLYLFTPDDATCTGGCLEAWPPLTVESEDELSKADGIPGDLGVFERETEDGTTLQVTYNGMPLYYWQNDVEPGDITGDGRGDVWFIVEPVTLYIGGNDDLGRFIAGPNGFSLYQFTPDDAECTGGCLQAWPPLTADSVEDVTVSRDLSGEITLFEREDGTQQVAYNGIPLYYWQNDEAIGDTTGQGVNNVWFVLPPESVTVAENEEFGNILVDPRGFTLYIFTPDDAECTGGCLENWPPLTTDGVTPLLLGGGIDGELGVFERETEDGTLLQVTYNGMPLYYWVNDEAPGDTTGQGVGDVWFVVEVE